MQDKFNRNINYLRISVTDKCNLRCVYCMPEEGIKLLKHSDILSLEEIYEFTKIAVNHGINKVRITGGEPLVRRNILILVKLLSQIRGLDDLSMTTNAMLLQDFAVPLAEAGLKRLNISLDTMDPHRYRIITRGGDINKVLNGIIAAKKAGLTPIKINCVVSSASNEPDAISVKTFCENEGLDIRYIHQMDLRTGKFSVVEGGTGGDCSICNKLRLTSDGYLRPCLFNDLKYNIRELGSENAIQMALNTKPECGTYNNHSQFNEIGG